LLERFEIVKTLQSVKTDAERQQGGPCKRTLIAEMMLAAFGAPMAGAQARSRLRVINGGAGNDEPPGPEAA
jgi:hypothetical protein